MIEGFDKTEPYAPMAVIRYIRIIIAIDSEEVLILFVSDIYNAFQNNILPYPKERDYLILPYL